MKNSNRGEIACHIENAKHSKGVRKWGKHTKHNENTIQYRLSDDEPKRKKAKKNRGEQNVSWKKIRIEIREKIGWKISLRFATRYYGDGVYVKPVYDGL